MPDPPVSSPSSALPAAPSRRRAAGGDRPRTALAKVIPRRAGVSWWLGIVLAIGFAAIVTPAITADHWLLRLGPGTIAEHREAPFTVRAPMSGYGSLQVGGGVVIARGEVAGRDEAAIADALAAAAPSGPVLYLALFALTFTLAALFTHHVRRSTKGRLVRVQVVSLAVIAVLAIAVKILLLSTALSALVVPIAVLAMVPTMALDRVVGLASGVLGALVISLLAPFDIGLALLLLVQTAAAGLIVAERPRRRPWLAALTAGGVTTLCTAATYLLLTYLASGHAPELGDPLHSPWLDAAIGPAVAALLAVPLMPFYQLLVGEITQGKLIALEDLGHPLLRQIAGKAPGTWQHSLMMANMAEIAANAIGANGRLVRVGAYYHDLGKSLQPKYFIENLEAGETSPHDLLPPEVSCDAIFAHVTEGIVAARKAGLHERIVDFMHMHHGNGVLEYFWAKCREQGNPNQLTVDDFRYPGHPPQSRETALLAICDAVEAASRTLTKPDATSIDSLVQRIVYGKLHLGQLDESGLSMGDLRRISDSLRETIRHANHGRIEYPWQKAGQDASASAAAPAYSTTAPRLDSLDRKPARDTARSIPGAAAGDLGRPAPRSGDSDAALAITADAKLPAPAPHPGAETSDATRIRAGTARNAAAVPVARPEPEPSDARAAFDRTDRLAAPSPIPDRPSLDAAPAAPPRAAVPAPAGAGSTQLATALASLAQRVSAAPFGKPADAGAASPDPGSDAAITRPSLAAPARGTDQLPRTPDDAAGAASLEAIALPPSPANGHPSPRAAAKGRPGSVPSMLAATLGTLNDDAGVTEPSMPVLAIGDQRRVDTPVPPAAAASEAQAGWASGLAARVDAVLDDEWRGETPIVAPTEAELRALLGQPDPTRQQPIEDIERLQRRAAELRSVEQPRRAPHPTAEVDPDDIEAAIEVAPPARRATHPHAVAAVRPRKPE
jgi:putative nucleotidyltransferase with HDIG domain